MSRLHPDEDSELLLAVAEGDREALARLYDRFSPQLLGVVIHILGSRQDSEDLLHDLFLEVWQVAGDYDPSRGSVRTWLSVRARSRAIDRLRNRATKARLAQPSVEGAAIESPAPDAEHCAVRSALEALPADQSAVVALAYFAGLTSEQISDALGLPIGTVKSRMATAMGKLRASLS